jgi:hypothetical protein
MKFCSRSRSFFRWWPVSRAFPTRASEAPEESGRAKPPLPSRLGLYPIAVLKEQLLDISEIWDKVVELCCEVIIGYNPGRARRPWGRPRLASRPPARPHPPAERHHGQTVSRSEPPLVALERHGEYHWHHGRCAHFREHLPVL